MKHVSRPHPQPPLRDRVGKPGAGRAVALAGAMLLPVAVHAQGPVSSTYATRDGRVVASVLGCASTDGSFTAQPCGVAGYPLHVQVDNSGGTQTSSPGAASGQLTGVQGGGPGALPIAVSQSGGWTLALPNGSHVMLDAGANVIGGVAQSGPWSVSVNNLPATRAISAASLPLPAGAATAAGQPAINGDGGSLVHVMNLPATQAVSVGNFPATQAVNGTVSVANLPATQAVSAASLPLPAGAAIAANQPTLNADGGALAHVANFPATQAVSGSVTVGNLPATQAVSGAVSVTNLPATQAVSAASLPLPAGAATAANQAAVNADGGSQVHLVNALPAGGNTIGTVVVANRSASWTDASVTAIATASSPASLAAVAARVGLHVWNLGTATACLNYAATAAASGGGCAPGSVPIPGGSAYLEDQPGNVSPDAISLVCAGAACPLTIKVR